MEKDDSKLPDLKLDAKQAQGFISFYRKLPQNAQAVRFFDRRDYYTAHGDDALFIAKTYYHTTTALRQLGNGHDALSSVSISRNMFETIIRNLLLERTDHTVELFEGSGSNWRLAKTGTPGKLGSFEDILFASNDMQDTPVIIALQYVIRENEYLVGMAFVDLTKRTLGITEFLDDSQYSNLESAMIALGCRECLLPLGSGKSSDNKRLHDVLASCNVLLTEKKKSDFKSRDVDQDLCRLVKGSVESLKDLVASSECAAGALGALLSYTDLLADDSNYGKFTIQHYNIGSFMRLDAAALRALNVLESKTDANKNFSLFGLMNRTCTAGMGKRLLNRWLKQPLLDVEEIKCRLDMVQAFVEDAALRQDLRLHLKRIADIDRLVRKLEKGRANLQDITSIRLPVIKSSLERYQGDFSLLIRERYLDAFELWTDKEHLTKFAALVEAAVDLDQLDNGEYMISAGYDPSLMTLKNERDEVEEQIQKVHHKAADDLDLPVDKALKLDKGTQFGHVFRITKKEEPKVRKKLNTQYIVLETRKDGVKFTNAKLKRLGEQYIKLSDEYSSSQRQLVNRVVQTAATFTEVFEVIANILSELDVLLSFSDLAVSCPTPYVRPDITSSEEGDIVLKGSRHPCVEAQDGVNFIPNDCCLVRGKSWFQIITGPNMGGKSTFIRQVGVNVLMAQVGCFVPCDQATISIRDCIFARVGAGDCQLRGVSTFMSEMLETAAILKGATHKSLIIIDELGRGTSTYDGFGLAWAICEYLVEVTRAPTLFATHFHELTALAHSEGAPVHGPPKGPPVGIANYHVSAHIDESTQKLTMLYKVEEGPCDQSFGIHVAEFAKFPESVVALAREKAAELEDFSPVSGNVDDLKEEVRAKRKRVCGPDDMVRGASQARKFLQEFSSLPLDKMDYEQALQEVQKLKSGLEEDAVSNPWLQQFF
ncbi:DNA mismatch repair protein MSH2 isoform X2 [Cryptomeria japonica]|uniref:DNA mismatch repair protein MSH2 isoform X2 n=1 Tax=Cryptomeria japonica TaxID=3369 RepID=UPI0025ABBD5D|nr:DNA mismatch repair protein MSH2 isoform X2 [Cryptomeria japonica]